MTVHRSSTARLLHFIRLEVAPFPGRFSGSLRDVLGIVIAVTIVMTLRVPGISLALALIFLLQRERPGLPLRSGLQILGGCVFACAATLLWVQLTDGTEAARFLGIILGIFVAGFCMAATRYPLFFTIFGFYGFVDLSSWDAHQSAHLIVTAILDCLASLSVVIGVAVAVEHIFRSRPPEAELRQEMTRRLRLVADFFHELAQKQSSERAERMTALHHRLVQYAHAGDFRINELYNELSEGTDVTPVSLGIRFRIGLINRVLEKSVLVGFSAQDESAEDQCRAYTVVATLCEQALENPESQPIDEALPRGTSQLLSDIYTELAQYSNNAQQQHSVFTETLPPLHRSNLGFAFFLPNAFRTPDSAIYSLKLTLSAMLCYTIYSAVAWPGILTCVITVLFTGLSSTGAMKQKQLYRISGAAIGGFLGIATESLLFPNTDSITSLVVIVGLVSLLAAWIMRSPHAAYLGIQIGFAFFLTALPGFSAVTQISPARDRVLGVALGILVMWFIFDQLWPTRTSDVFHKMLERIHRVTITLRESVTKRNNLSVTELSSMRTEVSRELANLQMLETSAYFDFGRSHSRELAKCRKLSRRIETSAAEFYTEVHRHIENVDLG